MLKIDRYTANCSLSITVYLLAHDSLYLLLGNQMLSSIFQLCYFWHKPAESKNHPRFQTLLYETLSRNQYSFHWRAKVKWSLNDSNSHARTPVWKHVKLHSTSTFRNPITQLSRMLTSIVPKKPWRSTSYMINQTAFQKHLKVSHDVNNKKRFILPYWW